MNGFRCIWGRSRWLLALNFTLASLLSVACGDDAESAERGRFHLYFDSESTPDGVDSVMYVFRDEVGTIVHGPIAAHLEGGEAVAEDVPLTAVSVEVDYLRNGGLALFESSHPIEWEKREGGTGLRVARVSHPLVALTAPQVSRWSTAIEPARILVEASGNPGADLTVEEPVELPVRGVAYSPAPIGASNKYAPALGDYFWDGKEIEGAGTLLDWSKVWRRDLEAIRADFNAIRVYSMISVQLESDGRLPDPITDAQRFTHHRFLDALWNNGHQPVYVLVGLPMPADVYQLHGDAGARAFWLSVLEETVTEVGLHPAVMGFTIFNEIGGAAEWGGDEAMTQHYFETIESVSKTVSELAPDKLVGFAFFDAPALITEGEPFLEAHGEAIDFYGVNAFQPETVEPTLAPYRALGAAKKPVLFTELGLPATTRTDTSTCEEGAGPSEASVASITETPASRARTAQALDRVLPEALADSVAAGVFYFSWSDEWWKQDPSACYATSDASWEGGAPAPGFPNGYWDEEGFGLHSVALEGREAGAVFSPFDPSAATANNSPDRLTPRLELLEAVRRAFHR